MAFTAPKVATWIIKTPTTPKLTTKTPAPHGRFLFCAVAAAMLIDPIHTHRPHPEEQAKPASRRMAAGEIGGLMVRDGASRLLTMRIALV